MKMNKQQCKEEKIKKNDKKDKENEKANTTNDVKDSVIASNQTGNGNEEGQKHLESSLVNNVRV